MKIEKNQMFVSSFMKTEKLKNKLSVFVSVFTKPYIIFLDDVSVTVLNAELSVR
jgi:hypothetical protein